MSATRRELYRIHGGALLPDTPGIRELRLWSVDGGLDCAFPDVEDLARECRFGGCRHESEPDCAVIAAAAAGQIPLERLAGYRKLRVVDAAFATHMDLNRLFARADVENVGSHRAMETLGMTREGVLRKNRVERGEAIDEVCYAILRDEWEVLNPRHRRRWLANPPRSTLPPESGERRGEP